MCSVEVADAVSRQQRCFDRAEDLRSTKMSARCIELTAPAPEVSERPAFEFLGKSGACTGIELGRTKERLDECLDVQTGSADNQWSSVGFTRIGEPFFRVARPSRGGITNCRIDDVDPVVRDAPALSRVWLGGADIEPAIHLPGVGAENRPAMSRGQIESSFRLTRGCRAANDAESTAAQIAALLRPR